MKFKPLLDKELFTVKSSVGSITFITLLLPMLFESVAATVLGTVNTAVISGYSELASAAVGAAAPIVSAVLIIASVLSRGATVIITNCIGAGKIRDAEESCFTGLAVCTAIMLALTPVAMLCAEPIMAMQNLRGEVLSYASGYLRLRFCFIAVSGGTSYLLATLNSYGHTKYTFYSGIIQNVVNLTLSFAVVKIPTLSADEVVGGIALSAGAGSLAALGMAIAVFVRKGIGLHRPRRLTDTLMWTGRILRIGLPSAISSASFTISQIVTTAFVATLGDSALAAKVFYTNILSYVYLFSFNAGAANAILVGIRYGAGELHEADRMNRALTRLTMIVNLTLSVGVILLHRPLVGIFTSSEQIIALAVGVFAIDIITEQGRAISHIYEYALRSVGDVWATLAVTLASCWIFSIGLAYLLSVRLGLGLAGCWIGLAADEATRGIFTYLRWRRKGWHSLPAISENG